ncbi:hypothetical protein V5O48_006097 [Marasmius crinis-equi]|uniref:F-box domain-containing protein n=1 Tax=Marasmius crinis-equi TaxID=585013 RepID=A0ABR3FKN1_9AGAR
MLCRNHARCFNAAVIKLKHAHLVVVEFEEITYLGIAEVFTGARLSLFLVRKPSADDQEDAEREHHGGEAISTDSGESPLNLAVLEPEPRNNCPISQLPPELLILILDECINSQDAILFQKPLCFAFSQVCHDWRGLALNTPTLWTKPDSQLGAGDAAKGKRG